MVKIQIITLFPEMFHGALNASMLWKAQEQKAVEFSFVNLRDFGLGPRQQVDDTPYGGGDGMLMMVEPLVAAIEFAESRPARPVGQTGGVTSHDLPVLSARQAGSRVILPTPRGKLYKQSDAKRLAAGYEDLIIVCPRYEGYDERVTKWVDEQFCIGNYVLTGGELPAMVIIDSIVRLLPGVLGGEASAEIESFQADDRTVEFPQYTRPETFRDMKVPDVLISGHHAQIEAWRREHSG